MRLRRAFQAWVTMARYVAIATRRAADITAYMVGCMPGAEWAKSGCIPAVLYFSAPIQEPFARPRRPPRRRPVA
ncbi:hypothetical protein DB795_22160, partial [Xanthomonas perforans]